MDGRFAIALIIACAPLLTARAQGPSGEVAPAPDGTAPAVVTPAPPGDVPLTGEAPAAVTRPGAAITQEAPTVPVAGTAPAAAVSADPHGYFYYDPDAYNAVTTAKGISLHKPIYLYPATYSGAYRGKSTEVLFSISLKLRLFNLPLYFAYSQKSFFQAYNGGDSKPFRENDFNPELFYRFIPADRAKWFHLGADAGIEHESNGQSLPGSRSWNRIYFAPFWAQDKTLVYWKFWYRIPEKDRDRDDPKRDDNPDILAYYGISELHIQQQFFGKQAAHLLLRYNPTRGRGAVNLQYTIPGPGSNFFWSAYIFNGYGESLLDYNRSITRIGLGITLNR